MKNQKIFVSYSRADSDFAIKFTRDMKDTGADIWLDKLDIRLGKKWDMEIEKALEACHSLFFIVSPGSVSSDNVLNEVYFALEAGKNVFPIIKEECKIPFRLIRLQYVDFSTDYEKGLHLLLSELGLYPKTGNEEEQELTFGQEREESPKPYSTREPFSAKSAAQPVPFTNKADSVTPDTGSPNSKRKYFIIGGGALVLIIILIIILKVGTGNKGSGNKTAVYDTAEIKAMYDSAAFYRNINDYAALDWYKRIGDSGDPHGWWNVGFIYETGDYGIERNYESAFEWYMKSAENGDTSAMVKLSDLYRDGLGVERDMLKATEWLKKAQEVGKAQATQQK